MNQGNCFPIPTKVNQVVIDIDKNVGSGPKKDVDPKTCFIRVNHVMPTNTKTAP